MSLFTEPLEDGTSRYPGPAVMYVDGVPSTNSAAKFWPSLVDEVCGEYPACTRLELSAAATAPLLFEDLFPSWSLQQGLDELRDADIRKAMERTLAELELLGGPTAVVLRLLSGDAEPLLKGLPQDCIDAETFPFLLVWLLEWAGVHHSRWNDDRVAGELTMVNHERRLRYELAFELLHEHLSEGLYRRTVSIRFQREGVGGADQ
jgi:hypothetical protein